MMFLGVLKRIVPFFLTFAAGLFIASFFINIASPSSFSFPRKSYKYRELHRLRQENRELIKANSELREQLEEARRNADLMTVKEHVYKPLELKVLPPPPPPRAAHPRHER